MIAMLYEIFITSVDKPVQIIQAQGLIPGNAVFKDFSNNALLKKNNIGPVPMHLEKQRNIITEIDGKASFVFILPDFFDTLSDEFFKEINTISSRPVKILGK